MIFPAEDMIVDSPRATPLYAAAASASEANIWTSVNGWSLARVFTSVEKEYHAAKNSAAIADLGALSRWAVRGREAAQFLSRITTAPAPRLGVGESARGLILDGDGGVLDLAEVSRLSDDLFLLTTPTAHARRLQLGARGVDALGEDICEAVAAIGVFGPRASEVLSAAGMKMPGEDVAASAVVRGVETAARPIQFGALAGVELIFPAADALTIWERLVRRGKAGPIGLDAMEILRIESGAPRPGVDFVAADHPGTATRRTPAEIGLPHLAPLDRGWYNGRRGLRYVATQPERRLVTLSIDDERSMPGAAVFAGGKPVGRITSCAWSPAIKRVVAFADVARPVGAKAYEIAVPAPREGRVAAKLYETPESALAKAFRQAQDAVGKL
jgi:glycine cleavage system T protein (aminomethyltransferase)